MLTYDVSHHARHGVARQRPRASATSVTHSRVGERAPGELDDLAAAVWLQAHDAAWLGRDWTALEQQLAPDVALLSPELRVWLAGRRAVLAHLRAMMQGAWVHEYNATDLRGRSSGAIGIVSYGWQLDWTFDHRRRQNSGRELLVLRAAPACGGWQVLRRMPLQTRAVRGVGARGRR